MSERGLARLVGFSQPHIHNVLQGKRNLQPELADALMAVLPVELDDLLTPSELQRAGAAPPQDARPIPVLEGVLGAGAPFPRLPSARSGGPSERYYAGAALEGVTSPAAVRVSPEERAMWPTIWPADWVILDRDPQVRVRPELERFYALEVDGRGFIARCRLVGERLLTVVDGARSELGPPPFLDIEGYVGEIVRGRIAWLGRGLLARP